MAEGLPAVVKDIDTQRNFDAIKVRLPEDPISITAFGASSGNDDTVAFKKAASALVGTGKTLYVPNGVYTLTEPITIDGFKIKGAGIYDVTNVTRFGSVLSLKGGLETTSSDVLTVTRGGWVEGLVFYYPTEVVSNETPAITATGYVVRLDDANPRQNARCVNNFFVNVPYAISTHQGWSKVDDNKICATKVAIHDDEEFAEHSFHRNEITVGNWQGCYGSNLGKYIGKNARAFELANTLATFVDNKIFGYAEGYTFLGYAGFTHVIGGLVDGTRYCVRFPAGHGPCDVTFDAVTFGSGLAGNLGGSRDDNATFESNCLNIGQSTANRSNYSFVNCMAEGANGDLVQLSNVGGSFKGNLSILGGDWNSPGRFSHSHEMVITSAKGTFTNSVVSNDGDKITGGTSGATAIVRRYDSSASLLYLDVYNEGVPFVAGETVTGSKSSATAKVSSVKRSPRYQVVRFSDDQGSDFSFQGAHSRWEGYQWPAGLWVIQGGTIRVIGNAFSSERENAQNCIRVEKAERFVEMGNVSTIPGAVNKDLEIVGPVANPSITGSSSWDRP